jgi:hypothetical protein
MTEQVGKFLDGLPPDRRAAIEAVREVVLQNLPEGFEETFQHGMIAYVVPLQRSPKTRDGLPLMIAGLGSHKNHMAVHLQCIYGDPQLNAWFKEAYAESGSQLDSGKACVRFEHLEELPLELIGEAIARVPVDSFLRLYEKPRFRKAP